MSIFAYAPPAMREWVSANAHWFWFCRGCRCNSIIFKLPTNNEHTSTHIHSSVKTLKWNRSLIAKLLTSVRWTERGQSHPVPTVDSTRRIHDFLSMTSVTCQDLVLTPTLHSTYIHHTTCMHTYIHSCNNSTECEDDWMDGRVGVMEWVSERVSECVCTDEGKQSVDVDVTMREKIVHFLAFAYTWHN